jgi:hypothetical protein
VSGVIGSNDPQMQVVDTPYLDNDNTTSNANYQSLISAIISAVGAAGSLAGFPTVQAITEIANRIVAAIPANVFTNDDDYVDSLYTIEQNRSYTGRVGAGNNATISLQPFDVAAN